MTLEEIADHLIEWAVREDRVRALWIEAATLRELRRPYAALDVHLAADEPVALQVLALLEEEVPCLQGSRVAARREVPRFASEHDVEAGGQTFRLTVEQSHLLAKRPRAEVVPLVDKTGHVMHVMDFSKRARR